MPSFEFATANRIIFGAGKLNELNEHIKGNTKHPLLVCGHSSDAIPRLREILSTMYTPFTEFQVHGEPTVEVVRAGIKAARDCDLVIGLGGGSDWQGLSVSQRATALYCDPNDSRHWLRSDT